jgi:hypothetical protein
MRPTKRPALAGAGGYGQRRTRAYQANSGDATENREALAEKSARLAGLRWQVEIETIAGWARVPRRGRAILAEHRLDAHSFGDDESDDTRLMAVVLIAAGDPTNGVRPWPLDRIARLIRGLLICANAWDESDLRNFITGGRWCPESLARLLTSVTDIDPESIICRKARQLVRLAGIERRLLSQWNARAA